LGKNRNNDNEETIPVKVSFEVGGEPRLVATMWKEE